MNTATILIITARPSLADELHLTLELLGYEAPIIASNAAQAREILRLVICQLILLDAYSADATAIEVASALEAAGQTPVIVLADLPTASSQRAAERCLLTPLSRDALDRALHDALSVKGRHSSSAEHTQRLVSLGMITGEIVHDMNNLLARALGYAELALDSLPTDLEARELTERSLASAMEAWATAGQILAFINRRQPQIALLDLSRQAYEAAETMRHLVGPPLELRLRLREQLPPVRASAAQLQRVLINLLTNAIQALGAGPGVIVLSTGTIALTAEQLGRCQVGSEAAPGVYVRLSVYNDGPGIDTATFEQLFRPFFTTRPTGNGLGLAVVARLIHEYDGAIRVHSSKVKGTAFVIYLPVAAPQAD